MENRHIMDCEWLHKVSIVTVVVVVTLLCFHVSVHVTPVCQLVTAYYSHGGRGRDDGWVGGGVGEGA